MKYFTLGKILNYMLILGILPIGVGLAVQKVYPEISKRMFMYGGLCLVFYIILLLIVFRITYLIEENKKASSETFTSKTTDSNPDSYKCIRIINAYGIALGFILGVIAMVVAPTVNYFYPNPYFFWGNIAPIIWGTTLFCFLLQINLLIDTEISWKSILTKTKAMNGQNPFRIGQRPAGFRLFYKDIFILMFSFFLSLLWYLLNHDVTFVLFSPLPGIVIFHFFLFCNIFRISRNLEIIWSVIFIYNLIMRYYWCLIYQNPIDAMIYWKLVLLMQLPLTLGIIIIGILSKDYHGIGYNHLPWGRKIKENE